MTFARTAITTVYSVIVTVGDYPDAWVYTLYTTESKNSAEKYLRFCKLRQLFATALSVTELSDVLPNRITVWDSVRFHMETVKVAAALPEDFYESDLESFEFQYEALKRQLG